jgi:hypothetical protein
MQVGRSQRSKWLSKGQAVEGAQRDKLWNDAEQTAMEQQVPLGPVPAEGSRARRPRTTKVTSALEISGMICLSL